MSILLVLIILIFCIIQKRPTPIICLLIFLLPLHEFIKQILIVKYSSPGIFPLWREIAIFFLFYKTYKSNHSYNRFQKFNYRVTFAIIFLNIIYYSFAEDKDSAISALRLALMTTILFISLSSYNFTSKDLKKILYAGILSLLITSITGYIERFILYLPIHLFMEHLEFKNGAYSFITTSFNIMNMPRMSGIMNGPNQYGVTVSFWLTILILLFFNNKIAHKKIAFLISIISGICLILSFSRAGWFILGFSIVYYLFSTKKLTLRNLITISIITIFLIVLGMILMPETYDIISASLSGEEDSAAYRDDMILEALNRIILEPWGHGLGAGRTDSGTFTESSFVILLFEIGFITTWLYYFLFYQIIIVNLKKREKDTLKFILSSTCLASVIISFVSVNFNEAPFMFYFWGSLGLVLNPHIVSNQPLSIEKKKYK